MNILLFLCEGKILFHLSLIKKKTYNKTTKTTQKTSYVHNFPQEQGKSVIFIIYEHGMQENSLKVHDLISFTIFTVLISRCHNGVL